jgi:adenine-specific DNA-methyltransferase
MKKLTADDPETRSTDLIADNIEQLKALFPEAITEGRIDFEVLKQFLGDELDGLKCMLDEIFGAENFVCQVCVLSNPRGRQSEIVATTHEYVLCYAKNSDRAAIRGQPLSGTQLKDFKHQTSDGRKYRLRGLRHRGNASRRIDRPNMYFPLYVDPTTREVSLEKSEIFTAEVLPRKSTGEDGRWEWGTDTVRQRISLLEGVFISGRNEWDVFQREFLNDGEGATRTTKWKTVWDEKSINYQNGKTELKSLFDNSPFDFPKPLYLMTKIIEGVSREDDIILDFFAGSGTTGHATYNVNTDDGGKRRWILIQLPEPTEEIDFPNISDFTKERLRRAVKKIKEEHSASKVDCGFRVFTLDSSNIRAWEPDPEDIEKTLLDNVDHIKEGRSEEDLLYELLLKLGLDLCVPIENRTIADKTVYSIGAGTLIACLDESIPAATVEPLALGIAGWHKELDPLGESTVVFRDSAFANDVAKTNLTAILQQHGLENVRTL